MPHDATALTQILSLIDGRGYGSFPVVPSGCPLSVEVGLSLVP